MTTHLLSTEYVEGLNTAFNEARLLGFEIDTEGKLVVFTLAVVCVNAEGIVPEDTRVQVVLHSVSRITAVLRNGNIEDPKSEIVQFSHDKILDVVQSFGGLSIYGWNFFDIDDKASNRWKDGISFCHEMNPLTSTHTLDLFQDGTDRFLDMRIWFDDIQFFTPEHKEISIKNFVAAGIRAWEAITVHKNELVQKAFGIYPGDEYQFTTKQK